MILVLSTLSLSLSIYIYIYISNARPVVNKQDAWFLLISGAAGPYFFFMGLAAFDDFGDWWNPHCTFPDPILAVLSIAFLGPERKRFERCSRQMQKTSAEVVGQNEWFALGKIHETRFTNSLISWLVGHGATLMAHGGSLVTSLEPRATGHEP